MVTSNNRTWNFYLLELRSLVIRGGFSLKNNFKERSLMMLLLIEE